jgi:hypothetical protein
MFRLFRQPAPFLLKARLNLFKAIQAYRSHLATIMTMVMSMGRVIPQHPAVIAGVDQGIDVCQVVPYNAALTVNPDLPAQQPTTVCLGRVKPFIDDFRKPGCRHDL